MTAMIGTILAAFITGVLTLIGVIVTNNASNKQIENKIITAQAVTDTKLENLTIEVRKHNNFAEKVPILEERVRVMEEKLTHLEEIVKEARYL